MVINIASTLLEAFYLLPFTQWLLVQVMHNIAPLLLSQKARVVSEVTTSTSKSLYNLIELRAWKVNHVRSGELNRAFKFGQSEAQGIFGCYLPIMTINSSLSYWDDAESDWSFIQLL